MKQASFIPGMNTKYHLSVTKNINSMPFVGNLIKHKLVTNDFCCSFCRQM